ncbi:hypothetical protein FJW08_22705 [Mesorhizobium sp. B3-2-1]|uniref:hypothetical protein n=1 Tax=unclassified Mesorhizobium TaxID=325217 RepID=UPI0011274ACA|nr:MULTISPECIES: hypothetical protein [unclassified Mesorhizobium]MBZ9671814.1 hypothetical protein [Mesorhizobium sp. ES1-3]TPI27778.1 hypothetical protein FJW08_22705 [Mesorhizobium sp. B3-2-1]
MTILLQWRGGALSPATSAVALPEAEAWPAFDEIGSPRGYDNLALVKHGMSWQERVWPEIPVRWKKMLRR